MLFFTWACLTFSPFLHRKIERMDFIESSILTLLRFLWIQFFFWLFWILLGSPRDSSRKIRFSCHVVLGDKPRYFASFNSSRVKPWRFIRWRCCFVPRQHGWTKIGRSKKRHVYRQSIKIGIQKLNLNHKTIWYDFNCSSKFEWCNIGCHGYRFSHCSFGKISRRTLPRRSFML